MTYLLKDIISITILEKIKDEKLNFLLLQSRSTVECSMQDSHIRLCISLSDHLCVTPSPDGLTNQARAIGYRPLGGGTIPQWANPIALPLS
jgi:hypothetical protein